MPGYSAGGGHLIIERGHGRMTQPFTTPMALWHIMENLAPVLADSAPDATWWVEPDDGG